ncbi:MAG: glycosyltransferase family 4 protein [Ignavibacteria bacterium]
MKRVLVISKYGIQNPSYRYRIDLFTKDLENKEISFTYLINQDTPRENILKRLLYKLRLVISSEIVLIHRFYEFHILLFVLIFGKPIIYDLDDAIFIIRQNQFYEKEGLIKKYYREYIRGSEHYSSQKRKTDLIVLLSKKIIFGNKYLSDFYSKYKFKTIIVPTSVSLPEVIKEHNEKDEIIIGWTGVTANTVYLNMLEEVFEELNIISTKKLKLKIVSGDSKYISKYIDTENIKWSLEGESETVMSFDIGIMPLHDDPFSRGKCAFKAIFFMSLGIPVVVSPVGANCELIENGFNGFLAKTNEEWVYYLRMLINDFELRKRTGENARNTIEKAYSKNANIGKIFNVIREL